MTQKLLHRIWFGAVRAHRPIICKGAAGVEVVLAPNQFVPRCLKIGKADNTHFIPYRTENSDSQL